MARGYSTARSESVLRSLGGGSDEIAQYRAARRMDKAYIDTTKELKSLMKDKRVYITDELQSFLEAKNLELGRANAQDGSFYKEVARVTREIEEKVAKTRAEFGTLGDLPMSFPRQDSGSIRRYYEEENIHMAYVKYPGDSAASAGQQVFFIGNQLRKGDTFTFKDKNGDKGKVERVGEPRLVKDAPIESSLDLGTPIYILPEQYYKRGEA